MMHLFQENQQLPLWCNQDVSTSVFPTTYKNNNICKRSEVSY
jgi:hypothetical protein